MLYCVSSAASPRPRWLHDEIIKWHQHPPVRRVSGRPGHTAEMFISRVTPRSERVTSPVNGISSYICERGEATRGEIERASFRWQRGTDNRRSGIISTPLWQYSNLMRHTVSARVSLCLTLSGARSICEHKGTQRKQQQNKAGPCKEKKWESQITNHQQCKHEKATLAAQNIQIIKL